MNLFGWTLTRTKALPLQPVSTSGGWYPVVREPYTGAWQQNQEIRYDTLFQNPTVFACFSLITSDIRKIRLRLVRLDADGIWREAAAPAFSPVLRKPNRFQTMPQFLEAWLLSKLQWGNTYVMKGRDARGLVTALYVLDPQRVKPLVAPDGGVYYELQRDDLAGVYTDTTRDVVPASEIIHDRWMCLFHPLVGVSPLYAAAGAAAQGQTIQSASTNFFANAARPSGVVMVPKAITEEMAAKLKEKWGASADGSGSTRFLSDGMTYQPISQTAQDSQLTEQEKRIVETIAGVLHVPASFVDSSHAPPYGNNEAVTQQYYSQCLQVLMTDIETCLDEGLGIDQPTATGIQYGTEFDVDDLIWMDTATRTKAAADAINSGGMSPNEAREKYFALGPVTGGDTPYMQQQYWPLTQLAERDIPQSTPTATTSPMVSDTTDDDEVPA